MFPILLFLCTQPAVPPGPVVLQRGQELVYRGQCEETAHGDGVNTARTWKLETRLFVLETNETGCEVAVFTTVRDAKAADNALHASARLAVVTVSAQGAFVGKPLETPPLEAVAPLDPVAFVELGEKSFADESEWLVADGDRPLRSWKYLGDAASPTGVGRSLKLFGVQQTPRFEEINEGRAWRRQDSVWLDSRSFTVQRLERVVERRDPGSLAAHTRVTTQYQLESSITLPSRLDAELRNEILAAWHAQRSTGDSKSQDLAARKLARHVQTQPPTPYREAVLAAQRELESARRGDVKPVAAIVEQISEIARGLPAPDAMCPDLFGGPSVQIGAVPDRVSVLLFFRPDSTTAVESLRAAAAAQRDGATVYALCVTADHDRARAKRREAGADVRLLDGRPATAKFGATATPRFIVIDGTGVVRELLDGYGQEAPAVLSRAVTRAAQAR